MSDVNIPLLRKMVEWVEEQQRLTENRQWFQETWITPGYQLAGELEIKNWCETACCVAGKVALMEGWKPVTYGYEHSGYKPEMTRGTELDTPRNIARRSLGLTEEQAAVLFDADNSAIDIRSAAEVIAGERL